MYLCRRICLARKRPKGRKKKIEEKNNAGDPSPDDTIFEETQPNRAQVYWNRTPAGDLGSVQNEAIKPVLTLCTQPYNRKTQDPHIPLALGDTYLKEKREDYDEETNTETVHTQSKTQQQKEGLDNQSLLSAEMEKKSLMDAISAGTPLEDGKEHLVTPAEENRQSGKLELLSAMLQEGACDKEQGGGDHASIILEGATCKKELKELQQSRELVTLAMDEKKLQEEQNTGTDLQDGTSLQELLSQPAVQCNEEEQQALGKQELVMGVTHDMEKQVTWSQMDSVSKEDVHKEDQGYQDRPNEEAQQSVELKNPDILSTMCGNHEHEEPAVEEHFPNKIEHNYLHLVDQENQPLVIPKAANFPCMKKQEDAQTIRSSTSDVVLSKVEDHPYISHQVDLQAVGPENTTPLPQGAMYAMDLQKLAYINSLPVDVAVHITEQKYPETQQLLLLEQGSTLHSVTEGKEGLEGIDHTHSGAKGTAYIEEQENQEPIVSEDNSILLDNISYAKEQQRKLAYGDPGPEGIYDKEDRNLQSTLYLDVQKPLVLGKLGTLPLKGTFEEERCAMKDNTGNLEMHSPDEEPEEQFNMNATASSKEQEATQEQEEQQSTISPQVGSNKEGEQVEAWHVQVAPSIPYEVEQQRGQLNLGMTCEERQKEETQSLSNITFLCNTREAEGNKVAISYI